MDSYTYVSRGGLKLSAALETFEINPTNKVCADLGCSTGGFTDCLLKYGATCVYAADTAYGQLAWKVRQDRRVVVLERTNVLHTNPGEALDDRNRPLIKTCDLVTVDLGWTRQTHAVPAAMRWLKTDPEARIITLIKPHYESSRLAFESGTPAGSLSEEDARLIVQHIVKYLPSLGVEVLNTVCSPIVGTKGGNIEYFALLRRAT